MKKVVRSTELRKVFDSINPNIIKEVKVTPKSCQTHYITSFEIEVGYITYEYSVLDMDYRYTIDDIIIFKSILEEYMSTINFNVIKYDYYSERGCELITFELSYL